MTTRTYIIEIEPISHGSYSVKWESVTLLKSTRRPFYDSARALIALGADPAGILQMRRSGSTQVDLTGNLGLAAQHTVREDERTGPVVVEYKEHPLKGKALVSDTEHVGERLISA